MTTNQDKSTTEGHRARLKERFLKDEGESMPDYELLELLLTFALPRIDTKPIAKELLQEFSSFANLVNSDKAHLCNHKYISDNSVILLKVIKSLSLRLLKEEVMAEKHILVGWEKLLNYLKATMGREKIEQLRLLHLNHRFLLLRDEKLHQGSVSHTPFYVREIVKRAMEVGSSYLIIAHNHPSGYTKPSAEDVFATKKLAEALTNIEIELHDHVIVSHKDSYSFKQHGLL